MSANLQQPGELYKRDRSIVLREVLHDNYPEQQQRHNKYKLSSLVTNISGYQKIPTSMSSEDRMYYTYVQS